METNIFEIPIKEYEKDMETKLSKEKMNEIISVFKNYNNLRSQKEFDEIKMLLHEACQKGDIELIKIYLSESIEYNDLIFKINKTNNTASLFTTQRRYNYTHRSNIQFPFNKTKNINTNPTANKPPPFGFNKPNNTNTNATANKPFTFSFKKPNNAPKQENFSINSNRFTFHKVRFPFAPTKIPYGIYHITIPTTVEYKSNTYLVTSISKFDKINNNSIKCSRIAVKFEENSAVNTINENAFADSIISEICFPSSLVELKEGWCNNTPYLSKIILPPSNNNFLLVDNKCLLGKSDKNNQEFDQLLFASRVIETISIPTNVTKICESAFSGCIKLEVVRISPNSKLQTIGKNAFFDSNISEIYFPSTLVQLEDGWRNGMKELKKIKMSPSNDNFLLVDNKYLLGKSDKNKQEFDLLLFASRDIETISIPANVTKICELAFSSCQELKTVEIPPNSKLQTIGRDAFFDSNITEIYFPSTLVQLEIGWCNGMKELKKIKMPPSNDNFLLIDNKYLLGKSDKNKQEFDLLLFASRDIETISIPANVTKICESAFSHCQKLKTVEFLPNSKLQTIECNAFSMSSLSIISIPPSVTKICESAFLFCRNLKVVEIPPNSNLQTIGSNAFSNSLIEKFSIPPNIRKIRQYTFYNCKNLKKVEIPPNSNLQTIGSYAFQTTAIESISIPPSVTKICEYAFCDINKLIKVDIPANSKLQTIEKGAFAFANIEEIFIPSSVTKIGVLAFSKCMNLKIVKFSTDSILQTIEPYAFSESLIEEISIPSHVTEICDSTFASCKNLKIVKIPSSVTKICESSFSGCKKLEVVEIPPNSKLQIIEKNAFSDSIISEIYFPKTLIELEEGWCNKLCYLNKITISPSNNNFLLKDNNYLLGKSDKNNQEFDQLLFASRDIETISIPANVTKIFKYAFFNCKKLKIVEIPTNSHLQIIESNTFENAAIESISIPSSVTNIGESAFSHCNKLTKVNIPINLQLPRMKNFLFMQTNIKKMSIPSSTKVINAYAFYKCKNLKTFEIPSNSELMSIGSYAFAKSGIEKIIIPAVLRSISNNAFSDSRIQKIFIPSNSNLQEIVENAFQNSHITQFFIPPNIMKMHESFFDGCSRLQIVEISEESKLKSFSLTFNKCNNNLVIMVPYSLKYSMKIEYSDLSFLKLMYI